MPFRPSFFDTLLARPLPLLTPPKLSDTANPPWREDVRNQIADLSCHPLLEAALHLMNDDLFSAHFLLRKMQEDEWGKWLHAILHQAEGDLEKNAKLWYQQVDPAVLVIFWGRWNSEDPCKAALTNMYNIMSIRAGEGDDRMEDETRSVRWEELRCVALELETRHGWDMVNGTIAYTRDEDASHKSMILGEGYRTWDKSGHSDR